MALPNFLVIGAAKAGTTALYEYLRQHPQVYMSPVKETNFFALDGTQPRFGGPRAEILNNDAIYRYEDYMALFDGAAGEIAMGEACPRYMFAAGTARRIAQRIPTVRLVAVLRNPVERAFSCFAMYRRDGFEPCETLAEAIDDEPRRLRENWAYAIHVQRGFYGVQLQEYLDNFPREQIKVFLYEDFVAKPQEVMREIFGFIGVGEGFAPNMATRHNVSGMIRNPLLRALWTRTHPVRARAPLMPKRLRRKVSEFFTSRAMVGIPFPEETRRRLQDIYREDVLLLQDLIRRDLSSWLR